MPLIQLNVVKKLNRVGKKEVKYATSITDSVTWPWNTREIDEAPRKHVSNEFQLYRPILASELRSDW